MNDGEEHSERGFHGAKAPTEKTSETSAGDTWKIQVLSHSSANRRVIFDITLTRAVCRSIVRRTAMLCYAMRFTVRDCECSRCNDNALLFKREWNRQHAVRVKHSCICANELMHRRNSSRRHRGRREDELCESKRKNSINTKHLQ